MRTSLIPQSAFSIVEGDRSDVHRRSESEVEHDQGRARRPNEGARVAPV